jgi:hypothetical protein
LIAKKRQINQKVIVFSPLNMTGGINNMIMRPNLPASLNQNHGYRGGTERNLSGKFLLCSILIFNFAIKIFIFLESAYRPDHPNIYTDIGEFLVFDFLPWALITDFFG